MRCAFDANPGPKVLSAGDVQRIHEATLAVLSQTGVRIEESRSLELLGSAGADVSDARHVRIPPGIVEKAIDQAPEEVVIFDRKGEPALRLGGRRFYFGAHGDCVDMLDPVTAERRRFLSRDAATIAKVCDCLPNIEFLSLAGFADDWPATRNAALPVFVEMLRNTTKPLGFGADVDEELYETVLEIARLVTGGGEQLRAKPFFYDYSEPTSPLVHSRPALVRLIQSVEAGIPLVYTPMLMMGATSPCSFAGTLVVGSADSLVGLVIAQLLRPGAPFIYGGIPGVMDMQTMICSYGAPEMLLMVKAMTDMAHHYKLPMFGTAGCTDAKKVDQQAATEVALSCYAAVVSGGNLVHDIGLMNHADLTSAEMMVLSDEIVGMVKHATQAIDVTADTLLTDVIDQVGPGGHYLMEDHTLSNFRNIWSPSLMDRSRFKRDKSDELPSFSDRLHDKTGRIIADHQPEPLPPQIEKRISELVEDWRKRPGSTLGR